MSKFHNFADARTEHAYHVCLFSYYEHQPGSKICIVIEIVPK